MFKEIHFSEIPSTHLYALEGIEKHEGEMLVFTAAKQTAGIGRKQTPWLSSGENLLATFLFPTPQKDSANLAQLLCYSTIRTLEKLTVIPSFKWPNDILLSHKKVAGVMAEVRGPIALVSIGLNVNMTTSELDTIDIPATSLSEELHNPVSLHHLKHDLFRFFSEDLARFNIEGFAPFYIPFASKLAFVGKLARSGTTEGTISRLNPDGRLVLLYNNKPQILSSGSLEILG